MVPDSKMCWLYLDVACVQSECPRTTLGLVPRAPPFLPSVCAHNNTWERETGENGEGIDHMNGVRWTSGGRQVGVRGGGAQLPKQCTESSVQVLYHRFGLWSLP